MNSMTGFGAATAPLASASIRVEIGGVNRKQTEVAVTLPRAWAALETTVRELVAGAVSRGRVNISISLQQTAGGAAPITINRERLTALTSQLAELESTLGKPVDTSLDALLRLGILTEETESDLPLETVEAAVVPAVQEALQASSRCVHRKGPT